MRRHLPVHCGTVLVAASCADNRHPSSAESAAEIHRRTTWSRQRPCCIVQWWCHHVAGHVIALSTPAHYIYTISLKLSVCLAYRAALSSVSVALSQTPAKASIPRRWMNEWMNEFVFTPSYTYIARVMCVYHMHCLLIQFRWGQCVACNQWNSFSFLWLSRSDTLPVLCP